MAGSHIVGRIEGLDLLNSLVVDISACLCRLEGSNLERKEKLENIISQLRRMNKHLYSMTDEEILEGEI